MNPHDHYTRAQGETEPLSEALREALQTPCKRPADAMPGLPPEPVHKNGRAAPAVSRGWLTKRQKQVLCQIAAKAYEVQHRHGLVDDGVSLDAWRRTEQLEAVGIESLRECRQAHYLPLRGHFEALAGATDASTFAKLTASSDDSDRQTVIAALRTELARFAALEDPHGRRMGEHRAEAYACTIAKNRGYVGPDTLTSMRDTWPIAKLWSLVYTLRNRIAAKRGVGDPWNRNKSQRRR